MLLMHGAAWLVLKTAGDIADRARSIGTGAGIVAIVSFAAAGIWLALGIDGYRIVGEVAANGPSNPLYSEVVRDQSWLAAYSARPWISIAPVLAFIGMFMAVIGLRGEGEVSVLLWSKLGIFGIISTVGLTMFPFILPSSIDPKSSLTVWDSSSSHQTLFVMLVVTLIFMPIILAYTAWVYKVLWGKVTREDITGQSDVVY
jgi:cytochrome d ubiquinol oxidase subunit II